MEARFFVRVNLVLVRLWTWLLVRLTGCFGIQRAGRRFRGDCCVLSKSDSAMSRDHPLRMVSVHGG